MKVIDSLGGKETNQGKGERDLGRERAVSLCHLCEQCTAIENLLIVIDNNRDCCQQTRTSPQGDFLQNQETEAQRN